MIRMQGFEVQKGWLGHLGYWGLPQHLDRINGGQGMQSGMAWIFWTEWMSGTHYLKYNHQDTKIPGLAMGMTWTYWTKWTYGSYHNGMIRTQGFEVSKGMARISWISGTTSTP